MQPFFVKISSPGDEPTRELIVYKLTHFFLGSDIKIEVVESADPPPIDPKDELVVLSDLSKRIKTIVRERCKDLFAKDYKYVTLSDLATIPASEWEKCRNFGVGSMNKLELYLFEHGLELTHA